jgi:predicted CoA-binding protein
MGHTPEEILEYTKTVATVGASDDPAKAGNSIPRQLIKRGFHVIPINPTRREVLGVAAYPDLGSVPEPIDTVQVFRPAAEAPEIARGAVAAGAKALWLQEGIKSDEARQIAEAAGLDYVEDKCMGVIAALSGIQKTL